MSFNKYPNFNIEFYKSFYTDLMNFNECELIEHYYVKIIFIIYILISN